MSVPPSSAASGPASPFPQGRSRDPLTIDAQPLPGSARDPSGDPMSASPIARFLGGPPLAVFIRLLFVSLIVGALLVWLNIQPLDIFYGIQRFFYRVWLLGWSGVREVLQYLVAGAAIVIPVWLVLRVINMRGAR